MQLNIPLALKIEKCSLPATTVTKGMHSSSAMPLFPSSNFPIPLSALLTMNV